MNQRASIALAVSLMLLSGCASMPKSCRGLPEIGFMTVAAKDGKVFLVKIPVSQTDSFERLQCETDHGNRLAMLLLGRRYEVGQGVTQNIGQAVILYQRAAADIPQTTAIYSPPVRVGGSGQMMFLNNPNAGPGLAEAKYRLGLLYLTGKGVAMDKDRGAKLLSEAAMQGFDSGRETQ